MFYKRLVFTHSHLMFNVQTAKDAWNKIKIHNKLTEKRSVRQKQPREPNE